MDTESTLVAFKGALIEFIETVEATGGITDRQGGFHPVADEEWTDLGDAYVRACNVLNRKRKAMSKWVDSETARKALSGKNLGRTEPCRETKYSWWEVFYKDGVLTACCFAEDAGLCCGEEIEEKELPVYVDDEAEAIRLLAEAKK